LKTYQEIAHSHRRAALSPVTEREHALLDALRRVVAETMDWPPVPPVSSDSYLPPELVAAAQDALHAYGAKVPPFFAHLYDDPQHQLSNDQTEREALDAAISGLVGLTA
jgi:hypothetical protein